jgi:hypothetical protein
VAYARVPDSLKQSLRAPQSAVSASPRRLSSWSSAVSRRSQPRRRLLSSNANSRPRRASWPNAWTAQRRRARAARPRASGSSSRPTPTERSPSGPGRTLSPARATASPCTAPTCWSAAAAKTATKALTSLLLPTRTADLVQNEIPRAAGRARRPRRPRARHHRSEHSPIGTAPAHALHNVSTTSTPPGSEPARRAKNLPTDPKTHRPNVTRCRGLLRNAVPGPAFRQNATATHVDTCRTERSLATGRFRDPSPTVAVPRAGGARSGRAARPSRRKPRS